MQTRIAILSYNHPEHTAAAIQSVLNMNIAPSSIVICHNGSDKKWVTQLQHEFPLIQHLLLESNLGFTGGINQLLKFTFTQTEWLLFLTNDVELLQISSPETLVPGLYGPKVLRRNGKLIDSLGGNFYFPTGKLYHCRSEEDFALTKVKALNSPYQKPFIPGTAFWLHKNIFDQIGPFDEGLHTYWEDVDYSQRALALELPLGIVPDTILNHKVGKTCYKKKYYTSYLYHHNRYKITLRYLKPNLARLFFKFYFWFTWFGGVLKLLWRRDLESLAWKWKILKDLCRPHTSRDYPSAHYSP